MAPYLAPCSDAEVPVVGDVVNQTEADDASCSKKGVPNGKHIMASPGPQTNGSVSSTQDYDILMHDQLAFTPRKLKVITVGAGFSGLMVAHKFQHRFPEMQNIIDHKIFESRNDLGGTWLVNTYPGVQCDVPSHIYVCSDFPVNYLQQRHLTDFVRPFLSIPIQNGHDSTQVVQKSKIT